MSRRPDGEREVLRGNWESMMKDSEFRMLSTVEQAKLVGVGQATLYRWEKEITPEQWEKWAIEARQRYAKHWPKIDIAMIKKAQNGDVNAGEYCAARFEGWSRKSEVTNINREEQAKSTEELEAEIKGNLKAEVIKEMTELRVVGGDGA